MNNDHAMCLTSVGLTLCVVTLLGPSCDNKFKLGISMKKICDDCLGIVGIEALQVSVRFAFIARKIVLSQACLTDGCRLMQSSREKASKRHKLLGRTKSLGLRHNCLMRLSIFSMLMLMLASWRMPLRCSQMEWKNCHALLMRAVWKVCVDSMFEARSAS